MALKHLEFIILLFHESKMVLIGLKTKVLVGLSSILEPSGESPCPCLSQLLGAACIPWLVPPSSVFKANGTVSSNLSL